MYAQFCSQTSPTPRLLKFTSFSQNKIIDGTTENSEYREILVDLKALKAELIAVCCHFQDIIAFSAIKDNDLHNRWCFQADLIAVCFVF